MTNQLYPSFVRRLLSPGVDLVNGLLASGNPAVLPSAAPLKAALLVTGDGGYTFSGADQFESAISASLVGLPIALTTLLVSGCALSAGPTTFMEVAAGELVGAIALFMDTGTPSTAPLVAFFDTLLDGSALCAPTNGGTIVVNWQAILPLVFSLG